MKNKSLLTIEKKNYRKEKARKSEEKAPYYNYKKQLL